MSRARLYKTEGIVLRSMDLGEADACLPSSRRALAAARDRQGDPPAALAAGWRARAVERRPPGRSRWVAPSTSSPRRRSRTRTSACATTCIRPRPRGTWWSWPTASARGRPSPTRHSSCSPRRLAALDAAPAEVSREVVARWFELHLLDAMGFRPELAAMPRLRAPRSNLTGTRYSPAAGGVFGPECSPRRAGMRQISAAALNVMRHLQRLIADRPPRLARPGATQREVERPAARDRLRRPRTGAAQPRLPRRGRAARDPRAGLALHVGCVRLAAMPAPNMELIVSLAKRRGFIFPSSEIYGGHQRLLGLRPARRRAEAQRQGRLVARDGPDARRHRRARRPIIMHPQVWEASGHVADFSDPMVDCRNCKHRFRADDLKGPPSESRARTAAPRQLHRGRASST